jgi:hypothetical protein
MYVFALHLKALIEDDRHKVTTLEDKMFKVRVLGGKRAKGATEGNNLKKNNKIYEDDLIEIFLHFQVSLIRQI